MMFFSKNEYSYLTTDGYKAAMQLQMIKPPRAASSHVHITGNTFQGSQIGIGGSITQSGDITNATPQQLFVRTRAEITQHVSEELDRTEILNRLDDLQAAVDKPSKMERYNQFVGSLGDHITVLQFILPPLMYWLMKSADADSAPPGRRRLHTITSFYRM